MPAPSRIAILDQLRAIVERVATSANVEVVEEEFLGGGAHRTLRIYIDKLPTVSHEDCETVSRAVSEILDADDIIPGGQYTLEVSSPGVERKLNHAKDWERFVGQKVKVVFKEPVEKSKVWIGELLAFVDGTATLRLDQAKKSEAGQEIQFTLEQVDKANLKFQW